MAAETVVLAQRRGGRQTALWGRAGTGEQQDSSETGHTAGEEFTWKATALAHPHFLPLPLLPFAPWWSPALCMKTPRHLSGATRLSICLFLDSVQAGLGRRFILKSSQGHLPTEHLRRAIYRNHHTHFHTN